MAQDTGPAKLPGLPAVSTGNVALDRLLQALCERLEVREGARGNPYERTLLVRDVAALGLDPALLAGTQGRTLAGTMAPAPGGNGRGYNNLSAEAFSAAIRNTALYRHLLQSLNDPARFGDLPEKVQALLGSIADEARKRGADVRELEAKIQSAEESLAYRLVEVTAAIGESMAGVRETIFASATANNATAGVITQVQARLNDVPVDPENIDAFVHASLAALTAAVPLPSHALYYQVDDPLTADNLLYRWDGSVWWLAGRGTTASATATVEQSMIATSDRVKGMSAEVMVKVRTNGAAAGFGLAASEDPEGNTETAFLVQGNKFAVIGEDEVIADPANPPLNRIPFGVDTVSNTVFINGQLRINSGGQTLDDLASGAAVYISFDTQFFKYSVAGEVINPTVTLTANLTGTLAAITPAANVTWTTLAGYSGAMPAAGTSNTLALAVASMTSDGATFQATYVDGATTYTDVVTVLKLRDGSSALSGLLTNEAHTVPATSAGVVTSWTDAGGQLQVFLGSTRLTTGVTYSILANPSALTVSLNTAGTYVVTAPGSWPAGTSTTTLTLRATVGTATLDKVFTLTKALAGAVGGTGAAGTRTAKLEMFQWVANGGAPGSFPSGTSTYTWATGAFTAPGTPNGWSLTPGTGGVAPGSVLYACATVFADTGTSATSSVPWSVSTYSVIGYAGATGAGGTRGTRQLYLTSGTYTGSVTPTSYATFATNAIAAATTGSTPTTPIKGDMVTFTNGTNYVYPLTYTGSAWAAPGVIIDGSMLVQGGVVISGTLQLGTNIVTVPVSGGTTADVELTTTGGYTLATCVMPTGAIAPGAVCISAFVAFNPAVGAPATFEKVEIYIARKIGTATPVSVQSVTTSIPGNLHYVQGLTWTDTSALPANSDITYYIACVRLGTPSVVKPIVNGSHIYALGAKR